LPAFPAFPALPAEMLMSSHSTPPHILVHKRAKLT
jgi:hypothetical protein